MSATPLLDDRGRGFRCVCTGDRRGTQIRDSWNACYRPRPDYDVAYRKAVLAVEALAGPLFTPNDGKMTLGRAVGHLRSTHSRWTVGGLDALEIASGATLVAMLQTLWHNQERHAASDGTIRNVPQDEAEAAVGLAVTLVQWLHAGLVRPIQP